MPTELPYAADAEMSLDYDELEVRTHFPSAIPTTSSIFFPGSTASIPEGTGARACHYADKIQLRMGPHQEPKARTPSRGRQAPARYALLPA